MRLQRILLVMAGVGLLLPTACKTRQPSREGGALRGLDGVPAGDEKYWAPCSSAAGRLTTEQLQKRIEWLANNAAGVQQAPLSAEFGAVHQVSDAAAAAAIGQNVEGFAESGGAFNSQIKADGPLRGRAVLDNSFSYVWNLNGPGRHLPPGRTFNNVIPQVRGSYQPEMLKYIKDGDIIVYYHPEYRSGTVDEFQQWRATHAAVIQEVPSSDPNEPCKLQTIDVPAGYARPFDGNSSTPFHVFRLVDRPVDQATKVATTYSSDFPYDEERNFWLRSQISRWGSLVFDKHPFNGYQNFTFKSTHPSITDKEYARKYLLQEDLGNLRMYCAWYVFSNANLAWLRPMSREVVEGIVPGYQPRLSWEDGLQASHRAGPETEQEPFWKYYALPDAVVTKFANTPTFKKKDYFAFEPMTAPEMALGMLDKLTTPDAVLIDSLEAMAKAGQGDVQKFLQMYVGNSKLRMGLIQNMQQQLASTFDPSGALFNMFVGVPDERIGTPTRSELDSMIAAKYRSLIDREFTVLLTAYQTAVAPAEAGAWSTLAPLEMVAKMREALEEVRSKQWALIQIERYGDRAAKSEWNEVLNQIPRDASNTLQVFGKKWVPPYMYMRIAEAHEKFYLPAEAAAKYEPRLVYVGTVVPEKYLGADKPTKDYVLVDSDNAVLTQVRSHFGLDSDASVSVVNKTLLTKLRESGNLNAFEADGIEALMDHWDDGITESASADAIRIHNTFGLGPNIMFRVLVNYWNTPTDPQRNIFRAAVSDTRTSSVASASENWKILQQDPLTTFNVNGPTSVQEFPGVNPRRSTPLVCVAGGSPPVRVGERWSCTNR